MKASIIFVSLLSVVAAIPADPPHLEERSPSDLEARAGLKVAEIDFYDSENLQGDYLGTKSLFLPEGGGHVPDGCNSLSGDIKSKSNSANVKNRSSNKNEEMRCEFISRNLCGTLLGPRKSITVRSGQSGTINFGKGLRNDVRKFQCEWFIDV